MSFASNLRGHTVIDDTNWEQYRDMVKIGEDGFSGGFKIRDYSTHPLRRKLRAESKAIELIPEDEWDERIEDMERGKSQVSQLHDYYSLRVMDQNGLGWCWCYGTVKAMQMAYARQGSYIPDLCAASLAAKIKGYRDEAAGSGKHLLATSSMA